MSILKIVMPGERLGYVVARIERGTIQRFDEADLVFVDHSRIEKTDVEETGFRIVPTFKRGRLRQDAIHTWRQNVDLRSFLAARCDELFSVLEVAMVRNRFAEQATRIEWTTVSRSHDADLALRHERSFSDWNAEEVGVYGPETRRQCAELNTFHATLFDKRDRILKVVMSILCAV